MNLLTELLFMVSTGLLVPVVVLLLAALLASLLALGHLYRRFGDHLRGHRRLAAIATRPACAPANEEEDEDYAPDARSLVALGRLAETGWHPLRGERVLADFEAAARRELELPRILSRTGPMLGLMGTLIPMGPALVGLAAGDIASMAINLQVAFSTTVVGLLVGGVGYLVSTVSQRWLDEELDLLGYLLEARQPQELRHVA